MASFGSYYGGGVTASQNLLSHNRVKVGFDVYLQDPLRGPRTDVGSELVQCLVGASPGPKPVRAVEKVLLIDGVEYFDCRLLHDLVFQGGNRDRPLLPVLFRNIDPA